MRNICCLNQISHYGTDRLTGDYKLVDDMKDAEGILVRSASLHETEFPSGLQAIARAGAGVNNIPLDECAKKGIVVFWGRRYQQEDGEEQKSLCRKRDQG